MGGTDKRRRRALEKELTAVRKQEARQEQAARKARSDSWKSELEKRIPPKARAGLEAAFRKGFEIVFSQGRGVIEKSYRKEELTTEHAIRDYAVRLRGGRRELRQLRRSAAHANLRNLAVTAVEGIGLGALGIGMPDVVLFLGMLLKGIYETALSYGFEYGSRQEQLLILKLMQTALSRGEEWTRNNEAVDCLLSEAPAEVTDEEFQRQLNDTASVFALDLLLLKFLQGLPVVGILGGAADPVYYDKVMKYVQLKYRKRYLLKLMLIIH